MFAIEKAQREELLKMGEEEFGIRNRTTKVERDGLLKMSSGSVLTYIHTVYFFKFYCDVKGIKDACNTRSSRVQLNSHLEHSKSWVIGCITYLLGPNGIIIYG